MTREVNLIKEYRVKRFRIKIFNTGLIMVEEEPIMMKKKVERYVVNMDIFPPKIEKELYYETIPTFRYIKNRHHSLVIHKNDFIANINKLNLPNYVKRYILNIIKSIP